MFPPSSEMKPKALPEGTSSGFCSMNSDCGCKYADYELNEIDIPLVASQSVGMVASYS